MTQTNLTNIFTRTRPRLEFDQIMVITSSRYMWSLTLLYIWRVYENTYIAYVVIVVLLVPRIYFKNVTNVGYPSYRRSHLSFFQILDSLSS